MTPEASLEGRNPHLTHEPTNHAAAGGGSLESKVAAARIRDALKRLLKRKGKRQSDLAMHLGISQATVKRALNGKELGLERLMAICTYLGVSLADLEKEAASPSSLPQWLPVTEEQESILLADRDLFLFFNKLRLGFSLDFIKRQTKLSRASINAYLRDCESLGLVRMSEAGTPLLLRHGWRRASPLAAFLNDVLSKGVRDFIAEKTFRPKHGTTPLEQGTAHSEGAGIGVSQEAFAEYRKRIAEAEHELFTRWRMEGRLQLEPQGTLHLLHMYFFDENASENDTPDLGLSRIAPRS